MARITRALPRPSMWLWIIVAIFVMAITGGVTGWLQPWSSDASEIQLPSFQREANQPALSEVRSTESKGQAPAVAAPSKERPKVQVTWQEIPKDAIPSGRFSFVPGPVVNAELNFPQGGSGGGDGTAFLVYSRGDAPQLFFTPDRGTTWFELANNPPVQVLNNGSPVVGGAFAERERLTLFIGTEVQPWVYKYWRADVPFSQLNKGPSP